MDKKQWGYLKKLADGLSRVPEEKFDMEIWGRGTLEVDNPEFTCDYAGCAIGWCQKIIPEAGLRIVVNSGRGTPHFHGDIGIVAVQECFGLDYGSACHLFDPCCYVHLRDDNGHVATATVADRINNFLLQHQPEE